MLMGDSTDESSYESHSDTFLVFTLRHLKCLTQCFYNQEQRVHTIPRSFCVLFVLLLVLLERLFFISFLFLLLVLYTPVTVS